MADVLIATIPKNGKEEYRVSRGDYNGHDLVHVRVFFKGDDGKMRPGKQGLAVRAGARATELADAIQRAGAGVGPGSQLGTQLAERSRLPYADGPDDPIPF